MSNAARLLGFAFANADLLFEIDRSGDILFATGATTGLSDRSDADLVGRPAAGLFNPADAARFATLSRAMNPGGRLGPVPLTLAGGGKAKLSMCYLPLNKGQISCTLSRGDSHAMLATGGRDPDTRLPDRDGFLAAAALAAGGSGALTLINLPNLPQTQAKLPPEEQKKFLGRIGDSLKESGAKTVGRISETAFGVVADNGNVAGALPGNIARAGREFGAELQVDQVLVRLKGQGLTPEQSMLAMRHVVKKFVDGNLDKARPADLGDAFNGMMTETLGRLSELNQTLAKGAFELVFDPIVDLTTGVPSHYEALTRFEEGKSPAEAICFAEEMGVASELDLAVALKVFTAVEKEPKAGFSIAMNVSASTIATPAAFALLHGLLEKKRALAKRVLIELTETSEIPDLAAANRAIQTIRKMGFRAGLDDFGAGAASLQYLHAFEVDFVKIDGSLIKRLGASPRDDALLRSVQSTCAELGIKTIAEWIENEDRFKKAREIGFGYGQGRHFGAPLAAIPASAPPAAPARRKGYETTWG